MDYGDAGPDFFVPPFRVVSYMLEAAVHHSVAVGLALADHLQGKKRVTACFFGDGATAEGEFSEHATANAIDITGFRLADETSVNVLNDWQAEGPKGRFLREIRDRSCRIFSTTLSPDYNEAHGDHFHLDQARRGARGLSVCR